MPELIVAWIVVVVALALAAFCAWKASWAHYEAGAHCRTLAIVFGHIEEARRHLVASRPGGSMEKALAELYGAEMEARDRLDRIKDGEAKELIRD